MLECGIDIKNNVIPTFHRANREQSSINFRVNNKKMFSEMQMRVGKPLKQHEDHHGTEKVFFLEWIKSSSRYA